MALHLDAFRTHLGLSVLPALMDLCTGRLWVTGGEFDFFFVSMLGLEFLYLNEDYILAVLGLNPNCGTGRLCWGKYMNSFLFLMKEIWLALTLKDPSFNPLKLKTVCIKIKKFRWKWVIQSWLTPFFSCSLSNVFFLKYLFHCHHYYQTLLCIGVEEIQSAGKGS